MASEKKNVQKLFLMTPTEARFLSYKAQSMKMTEAAYVRFMISQRPKDYMEIRVLLKDLIDAINQVEHQINLIASKDYPASDKELIITYMKSIKRSVREVSEQIGNM